MATNLEKTYTAYVMNRALSDATTALAMSRSELWFMKAFLNGDLGSLGLGQWTTYYSCDSVTAGAAGDGVDRWGAVYDGTKIVRGNGAPNSWYVLQSPLIGGSRYYMILQFASTGDRGCNIVFSKAAPTGGTTLNRPTATDEWVHAVTNGVPGLNQGVIAAGKMHGVAAADGSFHIHYSKDTGGDTSFELVFWVLSEPHASDLYPVLTYAQGGANNSFQEGQTNGTTLWKTRHFNGVAVTSAGLIVPNAGGYALGGSFVPAGTGSNFEYPVYCWTADAGYQGIKGRLADFYWAGAVPATTDPVGGPVASAVFGDFWLAANAAPSF